MSPRHPNRRCPARDCEIGDGPPYRGSSAPIVAVRFAVVLAFALDIALAIAPAAAAPTDAPRPDSGSAVSGAGTTMPARTTEAMRALIENTYGGNAPGAAVVVMEGAEVALSMGTGLADLEWLQPVTTDTSFRIGSMTKPFTAIAVLQLVEAGRIDLNQPISTYLPELPGILGRPTVRQLLSHTSGLPDHFARPEIVPIMRNPATPADIIALMAETDLLFEPGTEWRYSNFGYVLLGRLIEAIDAGAGSRDAIPAKPSEGRDYGTYIEEEILAPLGMHDSHYDRQVAVIPRRARGYDNAGEGPINTITFETSLAYSAGALMSSADDLALWTNALRNHRLLEPETRQLAWTSLVLPADSPDATPTEYGLGFNVSQLLGERAIWHTGSINGFQTTWIHLPDSDHTVAVLSNGYYRPNTTTIARRLLAEMAGQPVPKFEARPTDDATWQQLEGRYRLADGEILQIHVQDGMRVDLGYGWRELEYSGDDIFYRPDTVSHLEVRRGPNEVINGVTYHSTTLERLEAEKIEGMIEGAQRAIPFDPRQAEAIEGRWLMSSGDAVVIAFDGKLLTLQMPQQPPRPLHPSDQWSFFTRGQPMTLVLSPEDPNSATLTSWGTAYALQRERNPSSR